MSSDFCTYNIRGLNNKLDFAKDFIRHNSIGLVGFLETHVKEDVAESISCFLSDKFTWVFNYNYHSNGRIWLGWDSTIWKVMVLSVSVQQISCTVTKLNTGDSFAWSCIYGLNTYHERRELWADLLNFGKLLGNNTPWCLSGDFNVCLGPQESNKGTRWTRGMLDFRDFIVSMGLSDLSCTGPEFTWWDSNKVDPCFKKLDRCIVNGDWLVKFSLSKALVLPRGLSDHCPVTISLGLASTRLRKPFQFFLHLVDEPNFLQVVQEAWLEKVSGDPWFILTMKLKKVKAVLRRLNSSKGNLHALVESSRNALLLFQTALPQSPSVIQFEEEDKLRAELQLRLKNEELFLKQKSRVKWLKCGDNNNRFFFNSCKGRWNSNKILNLMDSRGNLKCSHEDISLVAVDYFQNLMGDSRELGVLPTDIELPQMSTNHKEALAAPFSELDVFNTLKGMAKNKSPGPDGLPVEFYLATWQIVGQEVTAGILHFFKTRHLPRIINSAAIALVAKNHSASSVGDYRPISCCNVLYKCITKMLTYRLKLILPSIISQCQSAFVPKRSIGDNIMLAQALCKNYHLNSGQARCTVKVDIKKAFDTINWQFLLTAMSRMGFPEVFISWVSACLSTCMLSVKINGSLEGYFAAKSGLRQGDPLSPYLFVIAMEVMTACIKKSVSFSNFSYHWLTKEAAISHLIFADDVLLFCKGNVDSATSLMNGLDLFSNASGLCPNKDKSQVFFGNVPSEIQNSILEVTGFQRGELPIKYLGLPLISTKLKKSDCIPLIQKICRSIDSWTCRFLSHAGRLQLLKVVLYGIQGYWISHLFLQKGILKQLSSLFIKFLWGGSTTSTKMVKVSWLDCCYPKEEGGLGLKNLFLWNEAAIFHQLWRILKPDDSSIWITWVQRTVLKRRAFWTMKIPSYASWCLQKIFKCRTAASRYIKYSVGRDSSFLVWHDPWLEGGPLINSLPTSIFSLTDTDNMEQVKHWMNNGSWELPTSNHVWVMDIRRKVGGVSIHHRDSITWNDNEVVSISVVYNTVRSRLIAPPWVKLVWHSLQIPKCSFFLWLAFKGRLLTRDRMDTMGLATNNLCILCNSGEIETVEHLFTSCQFTKPIFDSSMVKLKNSWSDYIRGALFNCQAPKMHEQIALLFFSVAGHTIWKERNNRLHCNSHECTPAQLISMIKQTVRERVFLSRIYRRKALRNRDLLCSMY